MLKNQTVQSLHSGPLLSFSLKAGRHTIKIAETTEELAQLLELRHKVFVLENISPEIRQNSVRSEYDLTARHLIIVDDDTKNVVGSYRLTASSWSSHFESARTCTLKAFMQSPGVKLEVGCACIAATHRTGLVIALLWKGLAEAIRQTKAQEILGLTSVFTANWEEVTRMHRYFRDSDLRHPQFYLQPHFALQNKYFDQSLLEGLPLSLDERKEVLVELPPLCRSYLNAGAKIASQPLFDENLNCFDFLTILDLQSASEKIKKHYGIGV